MAKEKLVTIAINSRKFEEPKGKITYDRVVALAYPDHAQFPDATYSIVYERLGARPRHAVKGRLRRDR
mgnify:CR=1 FL=1